MSKTAKTVRCPFSTNSWKASGWRTCRVPRVGAQNFLHRDRNTRVRCMHAHARGPVLRWLTFAGVLGTKIIELSYPSLENIR
jgi:hypothetical protein